MTGSQINQPPSRMGGQVYLGIGMLAALAGYAFCAYPLLIGAAACAALAIWLISSGMQQKSSSAGPRELAQRSWSILVFWRGIWRSRVGRLRYGIQS